jgi:hypothetical protein
MRAGECSVLDNVSSCSNRVSFRDVSPPGGSGTSNPNRVGLIRRTPVSGVGDVLSSSSRAIT